MKTKILYIVNVSIQLCSVQCSTFELVGSTLDSDRPKELILIRQVPTGKLFLVHGDSDNIPGLTLKDDMRTILSSSHLTEQGSHDQIIIDYGVTLQSLDETKIGIPLDKLARLLGICHITMLLPETLRRDFFGIQYVPMWLLREDLFEFLKSITNDVNFKTELDRIQASYNVFKSRVDSDFHNKNSALYPLLKLVGGSNRTANDLRNIAELFKYLVTRVENM